MGLSTEGLPYLKRMAHAVQTSAIAHDMPNSLAVGWSGGVDSTALLLGLKSCGYEVQAWHIDHAWHQYSSQEAAWLAEQAAAWHIPFLSLRLAASDGRNREAVAREGRYRGFQALAEQTGQCHVALGHHADDQAETVCLRMLQGAGVMGLRGMNDVHDMYGLRLYRPLLHVSHQTMMAALHDAGVTYLDDASNQDVRLKRNHIRHVMFPAMTACGIDICDFWMRWRQQARRIAAQIEALCEVIPLQQCEGSCYVAWALWQDLALPVRVQVVQRMYAMLLGAGHVLGRRHLHAIEQWRLHGGRGGLDLSKSRLSRKEGGLHLQVREASSRL